MTKTCLSANCPERKSVRCDAPCRLAPNTDFICSSCEKPFIGHLCTATDQVVEANKTMAELIEELGSKFISNVIQSSEVIIRREGEEIWIRSDVAKKIHIKSLDKVAAAAKREERERILYALPKDRSNEDGTCWECNYYVTSYNTALDQVRSIITKNE